MQQLKKLIFGMFMIVSTGLYANTINMAPIISYLLSDTTSASLQNFNMTLDVNESTATGDWKVLSSADDIDATATVSIQGEYGTFVVTGDSLSYLKTIETNATDTGVIEIIEGTGTTEITVSIDSLYWKQIDGGVYHTSAIKSDGTLWSWGRNESGQLGDNSTIDSAVPVPEVRRSTDWSSVDAGERHTSAIKSDGTLWSWGWNGYGQLGDGSKNDSLVPVQEDSNSTDWSSVGAGYYHTSAIKSDGTLWSWGWNFAGQLGDNSTNDSTVPVQEYSNSTDWSSVTVGHYYTSAIKNDGTLWSWGRNDDGQLGDNSTNDSTVPVQEYSNSTDWSSVIGGGYTHTSAIKNDGTLWSWGENRFGQLGDNSTTNSLVPVQEDSNSTDWSSVSRGGYHSTSAIKNDGTLWSWGRNEDGQLGDNSTTDSLVPVQEDSNSTDWSSVAAGAVHAAAIKNDGTLWSWGWNEYGQLGDGTVIDDLIPSPVIMRDSLWINVLAGGAYTSAIKSDGTLWSWGSNREGQLGDGSRNDSPVPVQEYSNSTDWSSVSLGHYHTSAIKSDGTLWSWGNDTYGQLGDNSTIDSLVPVREYSNSTDWSSVDAGFYYTSAIKSDGTLWSWGRNESGQLGDGSTIDSAVPVPEVRRSTDWSSVAAGQRHTAAIKSDGTLWSWGSNGYGQLGDGSNNDSLVPVQEDSNSTEWSSVGAGYYHTSAIKSDGTLWSWGWNGYGQLGSNSIGGLVPIQEYSNSTDWSSVGVGYFHTAAIKSDGTLWSWGKNDYGQLGDNSTTNKDVPVQEDSKSTDWNSVSDGGEVHTAATKNDGTLWSWGWNGYGQLGTVRAIPIQSIIRK